MFQWRPFLFDFASLLHNTHWDTGWREQEDFNERNDGRCPATYFTWFLAVLALRLPLKGVTNPQSQQKVSPPVKLWVSMIFYFLYSTRNYIMTTVYEAGA